MGECVEKKGIGEKKTEHRFSPKFQKNYFGDTVYIDLFLWYNKLGRKGGFFPFLQKKENGKIIGGYK